MSANHTGTPSTRERILQGAAEAMCEHGVRATTVKQVLERAGVSRRTFYQYYRNMDGVLDALHQRAVVQVVGAMAQSIADAPTPLEKLYACVDAYLDAQEQGGELLRILQIEAKLPGSKVGERRRRGIVGAVKLMDETISSVLDERLDPYIYEALLIGMESIVLNAREDGPLGDAERQRLRAVMAGLVLGTLRSRDILPKRAAHAAAPTDQ